jgi:hypothetical protein
MSLLSRQSTSLLRAAIFACVAASIGGACTVQLAPSRDQALIDGIRAVNVQIMQMYATTGMGVDKTGFAQRAEGYNGIIGRVDALRLQSMSRPVPDSALLQKADDAIRQWTGANLAPPGPADDQPLEDASRACAVARRMQPAPNFSRPAPAVQVGSQPYVPASASALEQVSRAMRLLRDTDCVHGLNSGEVAANRGYTQYFIAEALYYENLLQP